MSNMSECEPTTDKKNTFSLQGGEQKGMKKIVSLALSTAMALSMFASVSSAATMTTQQKYDALVAQGIFEGYPDGSANLNKEMTRAEFAKVIALLTGLDTSATGTTTYQDKNYANAWYKPFVEAVTKAGYMQGTTTGAKKLFNPNGKVTVQEMAATLVRAADLDIPTTGINNSASAWAKGEVQAAINAGLVPNTANFMAAGTRGLLVDTAYTYQTAIVKPAVTSYEVTDNGATVVFTLANGEKVTVKPTTALKPNVATTVTFTYDGKEYSESVTWTVTSATAATAAAATNLKEVEVTFNGDVNAATAEDASKYTITSLGSTAIKSAKLLENGNTVRLTLRDGQTFQNQEDYTVTVTGVTAGTTTLPTASLSFRPLDNVLPTVTAVTGLGTKAVKVTFSEPVRTVNANNFRVNDAAFVGSVTLSEDSREAILRPFTAFPVGTHTLTSSLVEDFNGLKSLSGSNQFTVAVDTTPPTVTDISATLERAVVTFSEEIDPTTVATSDFYWLNGTTKNYPSEVNWLAGNKYELIFTGTSVLPAYTTNLFVDSVNDYTGNANTVKQYPVTATVDQTRPTVTDVTFNKTTTSTATAGTVTVRFDRNVTFTTSNFTVTDAAGNSEAVASVSGSGTRTAVLTFATALPADSYSLAISGVRDTTVLTNAIEPVTKPFSVGDTTAPTVLSDAIANVDNRTITLAFSEAMDPAKLQSTSNYLILYKGTQMRLPSNSQVRVANNYKSVVITLPSTINDAPTVVTDVTKITPLDLTDVAGNTLSGIGQAIDVVVGTKAEIESAQLTAPNKVVVTFDQAIESARAADFQLSTGAVQSVSIDGQKVTLTTTGVTGTTPNGLKVNVINADNQIRTVAGNGVTPTAATNVTDAVAPTVSATGNLSFNNNVILLPFSEALDTDNVGAWAGDLVVTDRTTGNTVPTTSYATTYDADAQAIRITLNGTVNSLYSVKVRAGNTTITDVAGNKAAESSTYTTVSRVPVAAPTVSIGATTPTDNSFNNTGDVTVTGEATSGATVTVTATANGATAPAKTQTVTAANGVFTTTLTDLADEEYVISAVASNVGGTSTPDNVTVTVDTANPAVATNLAASSTTDTVAGTAEVNAQIIVRNQNGTEVGTLASVPAGGNFTVNVAGGITAGESYLVVVRDRAGNSSNPAAVIAQ
ncbi:Ig-like domain-containing protein [Saccharibacillus sp. JS10]|uniref:Ig-like domain-containing protein n=1 Tax=Saccharibacillus sp. JS10 TaxID=2950552 RepID=UPI00210D3D5A|nr:Ig-like domain-containing protein [Saccharibacillus sp. JS10]MCQ4088142.1 Ig-like domain-containing protein [Saccharibacillus sp. JS10]